MMRAPKSARKQRGRPAVAKTVLSAEQRDALVIMESGESVFLTGGAGVGKSTLLREFIARNGRQTMVTAPTGMAAINIGGATIHRALRIPPAPMPFITNPADLESLRAEEKKMYRKLRTLVIDEVSMVRADLLDAIDTRLRHARNKDEPFGGVQMIFVGDFWQLPPVVRSDDAQIVGPNVFAFQSASWNALAPRTIELEEVHRQSKGDFVDALNRIRTGSREPLGMINGSAGRERDKKSVVLTATNRVATEVNDSHLSALPGDVKKFEAEKEGDGKVDYPVGDVVTLKVGARVICCVNRQTGDDGVEVVNGSTGTVTGFGEDSVMVRFDGYDSDIEVLRHQWEHPKYELKNGEFVKNIIGSCKQIPLLLGWAITIHRAQGQTIDRAHIDIGNGAFAHGQLYVALSRLRSMDGLTIANAIGGRNLIVDERVKRFHVDKEDTCRINDEDIISQVPSIPESMVPASKKAVRMALDVLRNSRGANPAAASQILALLLTANEDTIQEKLSSLAANGDGWKKLESGHATVKSFLDLVLYRQRTSLIKFSTFETKAKSYGVTCVPKFSGGEMSGMGYIVNGQDGEVIGDDIGVEYRWGSISLHLEP